IPIIYPRDGGAIQTDDSILRFTPVENAKTYKVAIENENGDVVFSQESSSPEIHIPRGTLVQNASYDWRVQADDEAGTFAWGGASFRTISEPESKVRKELQSYATSMNDSSSWSLLAELDMQMGLWWDARADIDRAVSAAGENQALTELKTQVDKKLS